MSLYFSVHEKFSKNGMKICEFSREFQTILSNRIYIKPNVWPGFLLFLFYFYFFSLSIWNLARFSSDLVYPKIIPTCGVMLESYGETSYLMFTTNFIAGISRHWNIWIVVSSFVNAHSDVGSGCTIAPFVLFHQCTFTFTLRFSIKPVQYPISNIVNEFHDWNDLPLDSMRKLCKP